MGRVAPGDGESLNGAAALFTNQNVQGWGADQSGMEGRAGRSSTWPLEFIPELQFPKLCVPGVLAAAVVLGS